MRGLDMVAAQGTPRRSSRVQRGFSTPSLGPPFYSWLGLRSSIRRGTACRAQRLAILRLPPKRLSFPFGARPPQAAGPSLRWGEKSAVPTADPPCLPLPHTSHPSLGGLFFALGLRYDMVLAPKSGLEDAFDYSRKTPSQTFHIFSPLHFNDLRTPDPF